MRFDGPEHPPHGLPVGSRGSGAEWREPDADRAVEGEAGTQAAMSEPRPHFYGDVPKLGHVAVSRHAQRQMDEHGIPQAAFEHAC